MQSAQGRQIEQRLAASGVRLTAGRSRVIRALDRADGPLSAAELHGDLAGSVPLSSLYRTLAVLEETGVLSPHHGSRGVTRYELAEWIAGHHHHLVCVDCGAVDDIHLTHASETALESLVANITQVTAFSAVGHSLEIEGRCTRCR